MAAFAAFILATVATTAEAPRPAAPAVVSTSASASVTIIRAERVSSVDQPAVLARNVRREAGKIAVDFY